MNNHKTHDEIEEPWYWGESFYDGEDYFGTVDFADTENYIQQNIDQTYQLRDRLPKLADDALIDYVLKYGRPDRMQVSDTFDAYQIAQSIQQNNYRMSPAQKRAIINVYIFSKTGFNPNHIPTLEQYLTWLDQQPRNHIGGMTFNGFI